MIDDIMTVMWKERKGMFRYRGSRTRFLITMLSPAILATIFPFTEGPDYVKSILSIIISVFIPVILISITIPDSFAGERERHTLGTLLASRLPDRAILFGKFAMGVGFAWGVTLFFLLLSLVVVNFAHWEGNLLIFTPTILFADLALSFLFSTLSAGAGVLISLRSETVQQATQTLVAIFLLPPMLLQVVFLLFKDQLGELINNLNPNLTLLIIVVVLALADVGVFAAAMSRFQRSRMYLD
jgi:ABC-2 type transport system permease protein